MEICKWYLNLTNHKQYETIFQTTTINESLTVVDNESVSLKRCNGNDREMSYDDHDIKIRNQIEMVVLNYEHDAKKRPAEMNGGVSHRESQALQLAQKNHFITVDDKFVVLDQDLEVKVGTRAEWIFVDITQEGNCQDNHE